MSIQKVVKDCASFGSTDGSHLPRLCFDNITEYDPDVVFDKNAILSFLLKMFKMKPTYIQVLIKKKTMLEARIQQIFFFERRGSDLYFVVLHVQIFIQQNIPGAMKF